MASFPRRLPNPRHITTVSKTIPHTPAPSSKSPPQPPIYKLPAEKILLYADRGLVVINKPNGLISQLSDPLNQRTEPNVHTQIFSSLLEDLRSKLGLKEPLQTLHRLDKPTTGVLALACHRHSARDFMNQIYGRHAEKTYLALVVGDPSAFDGKPHGVVETKLQCTNGWMRIPGVEGVYEREPVRERKRGDPKGEYWLKDAVSEYDVLGTSPKLPLSLLRLRLHTGVKHQLRVHLSQALRTPILGDALYLNPRSSELQDIKKAIDLPRGMFLHSSQLTLTRYCPARIRLTVRAPLPLNFISVCERAEIPLDLDDIRGGVWVGETKALGPDVEPDSPVTDAIVKLGGQWYWRGKLHR